MEIIQNLDTNQANVPGKKYRYRISAEITSTTANEPVITMTYKIFEFGFADYEQIGEICESPFSQAVTYLYPRESKPSIEEMVLKGKEVFLHLEKRLKRAYKKRLESITQEMIQVNKDYGMLTQLTAYEPDPHTVIGNLKNTILVHEN